MTNPLKTTANRVQMHPNGPKFSRFVYGTWRMLDVQDEAQKTPESILAKIKKCLSLGITTFDLADIYGGGKHQCELAFGSALKLDPSLRSQMELVTKCDIVIPDGETQPVKIYDTSKSYIKGRVEESLSAVGVEHFDMVLLHRPDPLMDADEVAEALIELKDEGKVTYFGVSNFLPSQVDLMQSRLPFSLVTNQIEMSVLCLDPLYNGVLDQCQKLRMTPMIWSPLAGGELFNKDTTDARVKRVQECLIKMAKKFGGGVRVDHVAYAWVMYHPTKPVAILGSNNVDRFSSVPSTVLDTVKLTRNDWFEILEASQGKEVP